MRYNSVPDITGLSSFV